jgi:signal transduction histidine kinase
MSSAPPSRSWWRALSVRLTVYYSAYFVASILVLLGLAYLFLASSLQRKDREAIQGELAEVTALHRARGLEAVRELLTSQEASGTTEPFVVRVVAPDGKPLFLWKPAQLAAIDPEELRQARVVPEREWSLVRMPGHGAPSLEMTSAPLADGGRIEVGGSTGDREEVLRHFRVATAVAVVPVLVLGIVGGALLATSALRPIQQIVHAVRVVIGGEMRVRAPIPRTGNELDELVLLFNEMLDRIGALVNGIRSVLDDVAHELRTPIMRMRGTAELSLRSQDPSEVRQALGEHIEELDQLLTMLNTLMDISEAEAGALKLRAEPVDLSALIGEVADIYQYVAQEKGVALSAFASPDLWVTADRNRLRQVALNLLDNAIKYTPIGGRVEIYATRDQRGTVILIRDTGIGIAPGEVQRIWDRLYRGQGTRGQPGLGLGLSLVRAIVHAHHGRVEVSSRPHEGSDFTVVFPLTSRHQDERAAAADLSKL